MIFVRIGLALFGFLPFLVILYRKRKFDRMKTQGVAATGIVRETTGISHRTMNSITIEYRDVVTRQVYVKKLLVAGMPYTVGQELPLYYDPNNPSRVELDGQKSWLPMMVFTLLIGAAILFFAWKLGEMA